jgi:hypothetical protein
VVRNERGQFVKGHANINGGNPGGRPKGLAELVCSLTNDCGDQVRFYIEVFKGEHGADLPERMQAAAWLVDRGKGKAVQQTDLNLTAGVTWEQLVRHLDQQPL